jgi:hypothetical protein
MAKYYFFLFLIAAAGFFYVFRKDPCNQMLRAEFSEKYPGYEILDSSAKEGSPESVHCHIYYNKPESEQVYEDIWLYENSGGGWNFSAIIKSGEKELVP